jgi:trehalose synthase
VKGKPVVAGDVGGLRRQIVHGQTGLLVDPTDAGAVADAVNGLLSSLEQRLRIGAAASQAAARDYPMARLVADYRTFATPARDEIGVPR